MKQRIYPMLGFKNFGDATVTISGVELVEQIKKGQFDILRVALGAGVPVAHIREMMIAASAERRGTDVRPDLLFAPEPL